MNNRTPSQKQIAANQCNARRSTGPRTAAGKAASSRNAIKHGILTRDVVLCGLQVRERAKEFHALRKQFWEQYAPVGPVEKMLVDRIVTTHWRMSRVVRAESGEIELSVDGGHWRRNQPDQTRKEAFLAIHAALFDVALEFEKTSTGLRQLRHLLKAVRATVEKDGEISDAAVQETYINGKPNALTDEVVDRRDLAIQNADGLDAEAWKARRRSQHLACMDNMLEFYEWKIKEAEKRERDEEYSLQAAAILPSAEKLDKILLSETTMERQLYRAMAQLERLQRMRRGEDIPAPVSLEITR